MLEIEFHPSLHTDIEPAYLWYEEQAQGLGNAFVAELEASYLSIQELPYTWPRFGANLNRFILTRFPFSVIYKASKNKILVLAVMHHSRKPGYWQQRV